MQYANQIDFLVSGRYALFSDPVNRVGGEKFSYPIPTYQALKGIVESVYWKPSIQWVIDQVRVLNPIKTQSKGIRPIKYGGGNDLSIYTFLQDVAYQVRCHFEWAEHRPDLENDRCETKHFQIAKRMVERGGRRDVFLGTRECQGYVEPCVFGKGEGAFDEIPERAFGVMFHSFSYPEENGIGMLRSRFWRPVMHKGIITFVRPDACTLIRDVKKLTPKEFTPGENFSPCDALYEEVMQQ